MKSCGAVIAVVFAMSSAVRAASPDTWRGMLGDLVKTEKAGFGGLCGLVVDPARGTVWINVSDRGFYRSDDQAQTFHRCGDSQPKGRTESPGCFELDPTGASQRLLSALVYGSPVSISADGGSTWRFLDDKSSHIDWCAIDWSDPEMKFVLALKHESGGLLIVSHDGGKTFDDVGKGYGPGWVFDDKTAVVAGIKDRATPALLRTVDGGATWTPCGAFAPVGTNSAQALPRWHGHALYWLVEGSIIASDDKGSTWKDISHVARGRYGPVFGKDAKQMFVLTADGVMESTDAGATWSSPIALPKELESNGGLAWLAYDPANDLLYAMKMGTDLYQLARSKPPTP